MPYLCPRCENIIESLNYLEEANITGYYYLYSEEHDETNTEGTGGGTTYKCPECNREVFPDDCKECDNEGNILSSEEIQERENQRQIPTRENQRNRRTETLRNQSSLNNIPQNLNSDNTDQERQIPTPAAIENSWQSRYSGCINTHEKPKNPRILICKCGTKNEAIYEEEEINCTNCEKELNNKTAEKIVYISINSF